MLSPILIALIHVVIIVIALHLSHVLDVLNVLHILHILHALHILHILHALHILKLGHLLVGIVLIRIIALNVIVVVGVIASLLTHEGINELSIGLSFVFWLWDELAALVEKVTVEIKIVEILRILRHGVFVIYNLIVLGEWRNKSLIVLLFLIRILITVVT